MDLNKTVANLQLNPLIAQGRKLLRDSLPKSLFYHTAEHTDDVLREVILFALTDGLDARAVELLALAAIYHDIGFIQRAQNNEILGAEAAEKALQASGAYTAQEVEAVKRIILDTQVRQTVDGPRQIASTKLSGYLCDADVANLGRDDFFNKAELVRKELGIADKEIFYTNLISFISAHQWYSPAAKKLRGEKKKQNILELKKIVSSKNFPS